ncbi:MAG: DUF1768 domain-containing protein [Clostridia bacterium]|nr:DUF1768 domain-containing protein [Clostridia bacterium]
MEMDEMCVCRIVVMGGSFNPPTIAHLRLMEAAIRAVDAEKGIFVPVGGPYLKRKMRKSHDHIRLSESTRLDMLKAMCVGRENLSVSDLEIQNPLLVTKDTMGVLKDQYPDAKLYFIAGADKLPMLGSLASKTDYFERFGVVLFSREEMDAEEIIRKDERFAPYEAAFIHVKQPEGTDGISSTAVRKLIADGEAEKAYPYLHRDVWEMVRRLAPGDFPEEIEQFREEYEFLSNGYLSEVEYEGLSYPCAEAAFQAARCMKEKDRKRFLKADGARAKSIAAKIEPKPDWEEIKLAVMEKILRCKFMENPDLARRLTDTKDAVLINGVKGSGLFWGKDLYTDRGENQLGRLLMKLRAELRNEKEDEQ